MNYNETRFKKNELYGVYNVMTLHCIFWKSEPKISVVN